MAFIIKAARAWPSIFSAIIINGRASLAAISRAGIISSTESIFSSVTRIMGSLYLKSPFFSSVTKALAKYPESNLNPSTKSRVVSIDRPSSMVIAPSLPAKSTPFAINLPIFSSLFAEIVAMCAISSIDLIGSAISLRFSTITLTALSMPLFNSMGAEPAIKYLWA